MRRIAVLTLPLVLVASGAIAAGPHSVTVTKDVPYVTTPDAHVRHRLDLYLPAGVQRFPVIVSLHGGGLTGGDKEKEAHIGQRFASEGIGTAVINYRLSPDVMHPAHVQDAAAAVAWVKKNISTRGGDPNAIFVIGHSAGAYMTGLLATDERYLTGQGLRLADVRGFAPVSGFYFVERVAPDRPKTVWGTTEAAWVAASPAQYIRKDGPPMLLLYADGDDQWRREQNEEMTAKMQAAGHAAVSVQQIMGRTHASIWQNIKNDGDETAQAILGFVSRLTKAPSSQ